MDIIACDSEDIAKMGISFVQFVERIIEIDEENGLVEDAEGNFERLLDVYKVTTNMWRVFVDNDRIIGYWSCLALNSEYQSKVEAGQLMERDINIRNLKTDLADGVSELLFDAVCLDKAYQKKKLTGVVMKSIYDTLSILPSSGKNIGSVWGSVWTDDGLKFFEKLGATHYITNSYSGMIYKTPFPLFISRLDSITKSFGM